MIKAIIFDLDGTLVDTITDIALGMNNFLRKNKWPEHSVESYKMMVGRGLLNLIRAAIPPSELHRAEELYEEAHEAYNSIGINNSNPYPGTYKVLQSLEKNNIQLAVLSNKPDDLTKAMIKRLFPEINFKLVQGGLKNVPQKPHPGVAIKIAAYFDVAPIHCAFIGDTSIDMETAIAANMFPVGAAWGFRGESELKKAGAKHILTSINELEDIIYCHEEKG